MDHLEALVAHVTETTVFIVFLLACINARGQGRRWLFTVLWGAMAGWGAECWLVHLHSPSYSYEGTPFVVVFFKVPACIGAGWGTVFYVSTWSAQRLGLRHVFTSSLVAGVLGVNLDLSLDPVANLHHFWTWVNPKTSCFFGVPFDNFISWIALIGTYGGVTRYLFRITDDDHAKLSQAASSPGAPTLAKESWRDIGIPLLGALAGSAVFGAVREHIQELYRSLGTLANQLEKDKIYNVGQALVFAFLFAIGLGLFWRNVFRTRRDQPVNWVVLGIVVYFHILSLLLLILGMVKFHNEIPDYTPLTVVLPMNLIIGFLAYAWSSIDVLFARAALTMTARSGPPFKITTLSSYAGFQQTAKVATPRTVAELKDVLDDARKHGARFTFRAGGQAFDTQSLNDQIVISLEKFKSIHLDVHEGTVTVGAGVTWPEILRRTLPEGFAPYIMVTNSAATVGGTLSSHSVSRFSPTCGREGRHIRSLILIEPNGHTYACSRKPEESPDKFFAVIAGLGYLGAVLSVTYELCAVPKKAVIETAFRRIEGLGRIEDAVCKKQILDMEHFARHAVSLMAPAMSTPSARGRSESVDDVPSISGNPPGHAPLAVSAILYTSGKKVWGLFAESSYVAPRKLKRSVFHNPRSPVHLLLQVCAMVPVLRTIGYWITFRISYAHGVHKFVDDAFGYTFFEDGNRRVRGALQTLGIPHHILQQTFLLPLDRAGDSAGPLSQFLADAARVFADCNVEPALIDLLYVGRDGDPFALSSSRGMDAFAVTMTFERVFKELSAEEQCLKKVSEVCGRFGGRVHLVKNVCADPKLLGAMYELGIKELSALRATPQAKLLHNEFASRVLGQI